MGSREENWNWEGSADYQGNLLILLVSLKVEEKKQNLYMNKANAIQVNQERNRGTALRTQLYYKMFTGVGQTERMCLVEEEAIKEHQCSGMRHYHPNQEKLKVKVKSTLAPLLRHLLSIFSSFSRMETSAGPGSSRSQNTANQSHLPYGDNLSQALQDSSPFLVY